MKKAIILIVIAIVTISCEKENPTAVNPTGPYLEVKFRFDSTQIRLDNFGQPELIANGHAGITPQFNGMSTHYIELGQNIYTALGAGDILYHGAETMAGGNNAVDFDKAIIGAENEIMFRIPLSDIKPDTYNWVRSSLTYQNYSVPFKSAGLDLIGTVGSFVGFNTYISDFIIDTKTVTVNDDKLQGYFGVEIDDSQLPTTIPVMVQQLPPGATTVPNPISGTSPIPTGSCVVTGQFANGFTVIGNETENITLVLSVSINKSFEFADANGNGIWEPDLNEVVTDMGIRGLVPIIE